MTNILNIGKIHIMKGDAYLMKKTIISLAIVLCLTCPILTVIPASALGGTIGGNNMTWTLDEAGVLTVSGMGAVNDFSSATEEPWDKAAVKTLVVSAGTTYISTYAFAECTNLSAVTLPEGLTNIAANAFNGDESLTGITFPSTVTSIGDAAFQGTGLTSVTIPNGVTDIPENFCYDCTSLTSVTFHEGITSIAQYAFASCGALTTAELPDSVTNLYNYAFEQCSKLDNIMLGSRIEQIDASAFDYCTSLKTVFYHGTPTKWKSVTVSTTNNDPFFSATLIYVDDAVHLGNYTGTYLDKADAFTYDVVIPQDVTLSKARWTITADGVKRFDTEQGITTVTGGGTIRYGYAIGFDKDKEPDAISSQIEYH